jgi:hypothetical protein
MYSGMAVVGLPVATVARDGNCQLLPMNIQWIFHEHDCNVVCRIGIKVNTTHYWTHVFTHQTAHTA